MSSLRRRRYVLAGLLVAVGLLAAAILWEVVEVVFFAITVAYVLHPLRQRLVNRGISRRIASGLVTTFAFVVVVVLLSPIAWTLFRRRNTIFEVLRDLPPEIPIKAFGFMTTLDTAELVSTATTIIRGIASSLAFSSVFLLLELGMFTILLYGLLLRPNAVGRAAFEITPPQYHDVLRALNDRVSGTLYALYVIQAATAVVTFPIALVVFYLLGYSDVLLLSVLSAILQFVPIAGPGMLAVGLAGYDFVIGMPDRAVGIIILGPLLIGLVPDLLVRPRLASSHAHLPASLYFVGFTGGVLTVGVIGVIAGPLAVAVLVEVVDLLSDGGAPAETD
ncbi:AI-2E family transporter [Natronomonas gomsonensis]|uniref:AI-2E family transporter n=1 Tax=Natronomonas gomsonensis TaxID=1046043 RepID=UPI0020CA4B14|nr:AI-2E family transporter [Natronomonas gomsonensis]MCY4729586.1 AI-2E family transporter [Natronomonas gomsonensis]